MMKNALASLCLLSLSLGATAQVMSTEVKQWQIPVLNNKAKNRLTSIQCIPQSALSIEGITLTFKGTDDIKSIDKLYLVNEHNKNGEVWYEGATSSKSLTIPLNKAISDTINLVVYCDLKPTASLDHFVDVQFKTIQTSKGKVTPIDTTNIRQRVGIAVRDRKIDGVDTYRIPGLGTTTEGSLLAIYDMRYLNSADLQGHMDIGVSRSTDQGNSWEPMRIALDMKTWGGLPEKFNGVSDATILTDTNTGRIWVAGLWMYGILDNQGKFIEGLTEESRHWRHQWHGTASQPGLSPKETCQFILAYSDDDGKTWSDPINITEQTKRPEWWLYAPAPGQGIVMKDGTLVLPTQGRDHQGHPFSNITYSKDGGKTWKTSNPSYSNTTECAVVELADGSLMLNMRNNRNSQDKGDTNGRAIFITKDLGETWTAHHTSQNALQEPVCMGSLHKHEFTKKGKKESVLLFSNPDSKYHRNRIGIKVSEDDGNTWRSGVMLDEWGGFGYSCITSISDTHVGILYEGSRAQMTFQRIPLAEILKKK